MRKCSCPVDGTVVVVSGVNVQDADPDIYMKIGEEKLHVVFLCERKLDKLDKLRCGLEGSGLYIIFH